jgi:hypothetical protein
MENYHITTFPGQSLSKTGLSLEEAMDLSRDRQIEEEDKLLHPQVVFIFGDINWNHSKTPKVSYQIVASSDPSDRV